MPFIRLTMSSPVPEEEGRALLAKLSKTVAQALGKPESYVMATLDSAAMMMAGEAGGAAFADVRSIGGLGSGAKTRLAEAVAGLVSESLGVAADRVYLNFTDVPASDWGWNGGTFG